MTSKRSASLVAATLVAATFAAKASAYEADVDSTTTGQAYQLKGPTGEPVLSRRRVTETLALGVSKITDESDSNAPTLTFRARMRLDTDFGESAAEYTVPTNSAGASRFIPGLEPAPVDLMYGYLEGRRFLHGALGFKIGRQYVIDSLGFYAFDGGLFRITTPVYIAVEGYGGFEVRGGLPLSGGRFELGGVERVDRSGYPSNGYPSYEPAHMAPTFGVALESAGPTWVHGRLTYRKAWNTGGSFVGAQNGLGGPDQVGLYDKARVSSERLGYGLDVTLGTFASLRGNLAYDLYAGNFNDLEAGADVFLGQHVVAGVDYTFYRPLFDADSIFSVFGFEPMNDVSARIDIEATERLNIGADARVRRYESDALSDPSIAQRASGTNLNAYATQVASNYAGGGGFKVRYKWPDARLMIRTTALTGDEGRRIGGDADYMRTIQQRYMVDARFSLYNFDDKLRDEVVSRSATSVGYVLGAGYILAPQANVQAQWEHDINRLVGQRFRVMAILNVRLWS